jgi:hypothetical protein
MKTNIHLFGIGFLINFGIKLDFCADNAYNTWLK